MNYLSPDLRTCSPVAGAATLADRAFDQLQHLIVTLDLKPGEMITESQVMARLDIGRTPAREALLRARYARLVEPGPGRSHVVTRLDFDQMQQVLEVSGLLERLLVARAASARSPAEGRQFAAMAAAFGDSVRDGDIDVLLQTIQTLNLLVGCAARQQVAARAVAPLCAQTCRLAVVGFRYAGLPLERIAPGYAALAQALAAGNARRAVDALAHLLLGWAEIVEALAASPALREWSIGANGRW
ncbi:MAG: GntR family transcriptional regulator [Alphaproteobacteria bacterium]